MRTLERESVATYLELGPSGVLTGMVPHCFTDPGAAVVLPVCREGAETHTAISAATQLWVRGAAVDWTPVLGAARRVALPTYPFDRKRFWLKSGTPTMEVTQPVSSDDSTDDTLAARLADLSEQEQGKLLTELVLTETVIALGDAATAEVDPESPFFEIGFNSLSAVELRNRLNEATGLTLSPMLVFDHPTPEMVVEHLRTHLVP